MAAVGILDVVSHTGVVFSSVLADGEGVDVGNGTGTGFLCGDGGVGWKVSCGESISPKLISLGQSVPVFKGARLGDSPGVAISLKPDLVLGSCDGITNGVGRDAGLVDVGESMAVAVGRTLGASSSWTKHGLSFWAPVSDGKSVLRRLDCPNTFRPLRADSGSFRRRVEFFIELEAASTSDAQPPMRISCCRAVVSSARRATICASCAAYSALPCFTRSSRNT